MSTSSIPEGYHTLTPSLNLKGAVKALEFYKKALNAVERFTFPGPGDTIMHGEFQIGDSVVMFSDESPDWGALSPQSVGGCPLSLNLYVENCDASFKQATDAGAETLRPPATYPWGERSAMIEDPYGYRWSFMQHVEDVTPEQLEERMKRWDPSKDWEG